MQYQRVVRGRFLERPNRFIARVDVDGTVETVHVKNTGRCRELLVPGVTVWLEDFDGRMGTRKLRYSLIAVEKGSADADTGSNAASRGAAVSEARPLSAASRSLSSAPRPLLINMDSQAPNAVVRESFLASGAELIPGGVAVPGGFAVPPGFRFRSEVTYGDSRFDFYFEKDGKPGFLEVKGCTLESDGHCRFPDAPTARGVKHLEELISAKKAGYWAGVLILVQMSGMTDFSPNDDTDPAFGDALRRAAAAGVAVLCYGCTVTPDSLQIAEPVPVKL